jgi:hypothetical protein
MCTLVCWMDLISFWDSSFFLMFFSLSFRQNNNFLLYCSCCETEPHYIAKLVSNFWV